MEKIIEKLFDLKKIPTKLFVLLSIISGTLLFIPKELLTNLHLEKFEEDYGKYFGIIFIISTGIIVLNFSIWVVKLILSKLLNRKYNKQILKSINKLDPHEKAVLREFYIQNKNSLDLPYDDSTVRNLINKRLLIVVSQMGQMNIGGMLFPMKLNEIIVSHIDESILGTSHLTSEMDKKNFILKNRPNWIVEQEKFNDLFRI